MMPSPRNATRSGFAMSASSRGLDAQPVAGAQGTGGLARDLFSVHEVAARLSRLAAAGARRGVPAALGDQRIAHVGERLNLTHHAVAAAVATGAARPAAHRVLHGAQRELQLE